MEDAYHQKKFFLKIQTILLQQIYSFIHFKFYHFQFIFTLKKIEENKLKKKRYQHSMLRAKTKILGSKSIILVWFYALHFSVTDE
jgi:hypothetical protein